MVFLHVIGRYFYLGHPSRGGSVASTSAQSGWYLKGLPNLFDEFSGMGAFSIKQSLIKRLGIV